MNTQLITTYLIFAIAILFSFYQPKQNTDTIQVKTEYLSNDYQSSEWNSYEDNSSPGLFSVVVIYFLFML